MYLTYHLKKFLLLLHQIVHYTLYLQEDIAFNWGVFDFRTPFFVGRFVFGLTDYELGAYPYPLFRQEYVKYGSSITEQVINLTAEEKMTLSRP